MLHVAIRRRRGDFQLDAAFDVATPGVVVAPPSTLREGARLEFAP